MWSLAFGGSGYTGATTGMMYNDSDGDFGPAFAGPLPTTSIQSLRFVNAFNAPSTTNAADYALSSGAVVLTNNAGSTWTVTAPPPPHCPADWDGNGQVQPVDVGQFITDWFNSIAGGTLAGDFDHNGHVEPADVGGFVGAWFAALIGPCP